MDRPTFSKRERIVSRKLMEALFSKGNSHSVSAFPIRIVYMLKEREGDEEPVQVLISVSKRHFKHAVKRNRVKRQVREAYRHQKARLTGKVPEGKALTAAFIWLADELHDSRQVSNAVRRILEKVADRL